MKRTRTFRSCLRTFLGSDEFGFKATQEMYKMKKPLELICTPKSGQIE
ncbi:hypothetical protein BDW_09160 [Bdellovibrio bacteriovorus W]|nr:hypothetical protein BDW_09160 [Bdellovibrio bacteriovorus W]